MDTVDTLEQWWDSPMLGLGLKAAFILIAAMLAYAATRAILVRAVHRFAQKSETSYDDVLVRRGVFSGLAWLAPAVVGYYGVALFPQIDDLLRRMLIIYVIFVAVTVINRLLTAMVDIYQSFAISARRPIKGHVQLVKLFVFIVGGIFAVSTALNTSPWGILSGLGALTAVLMLVFKDTILSFVAGIQIAGNDLMRKGDWIEMPSTGADGDVVDVALNTVKVRNFDNTITAIPTHKFLEHTFKNWRGMSEAGARRIKRAVLIDQSSVRFADDELIQRLNKVDTLAPFIEARQAEIDRANQEAGCTNGSILNGRRMTNLGLFRRYVEEYAKRHPKIRQDLTLMVRQLAPEPDSGLPLELYCFVGDTAWVNYEGIQSDIFDHVLAAMPQFGLKAYQRNALVDGRQA